MSNDNCAKIVIWGIRDEYERIYKSVLREVNKNNISVVALCCRKEEINCQFYDGFNLVDKEQLLTLDFDYIVIANKGSYKSIYIEASHIVHVRKYKENKPIRILSFEIFLSSNFDFKSYVNHDISYRGNELSSLTNEQLVTGISNITANPNFSFFMKIVDHCNLNCIHCSTCSPIADKFNVPLSEIKSDLSRMKELCEGGRLVQRILITGGEALLHPQIKEIIIATREKFTHQKILLLTNGIKLINLAKEVLDILSINNITLFITEYPINLNYKSIEKKLQQNNINYMYESRTNYKSDKTMFKMPLDLTGNQNSIKNFLKCPHANNCITLNRGRIYSCGAPLVGTILNKKYSTDLIVTENDSMSIYECKSFREMIDFLAKPIYFCRYCNLEGMQYGIPYKASKKEFDEYF